MTTTASRVRALVRKQFGMAEGALIADAMIFVEDLGADDIDLIELAMLAEEAFGIEITDADGDFRTVGALITLVERLDAERVKPEPGQARCPVCLTTFWPDDAGGGP